MSAAAGVLVAGLLMVGGYWFIAALAGWDVLALTYIGLTLPAVWRLDASQTAERAVLEDPTRAVADLLLLAAAVASLGAVVTVLLRAAGSSGAAQFLLVALAVGSVVISWLLVHTTYMLRYARIYYGRPVGGVTFNQEGLPCYGDFGYLAFTIGMTFQVSDTALNTREMRATALRHALLSYVFGTVILATAINLVAQLGR